MAIQTSGEIVVAGRALDSQYKFSVARYLGNGTLDNGFGFNGSTFTAVGTSGSYNEDDGQGVAIQADGKIVVAGQSQSHDSSTDTEWFDFALARYTSSGTLDTTFGNNGTVVTHVPQTQETDSSARSVAIQGDGKILVAGYASSGDGNYFALARYLTNRSLDTAFNGTGTVTTSIGSVNSEGWSVAVQSDGMIVVAGFTDGSTFDSEGDQLTYDLNFALVRYTADGALDTGFGSGGIVITPVSTAPASINANDSAYSVAIQADGKIVAAGDSDTTNNKYDFALVRYLTNGLPDTGFGANGAVTTPIGSANDIGYGVALQTDGKIVVAGTSVTGTTRNFAVARYLSHSAAGNPPKLTNPTRLGNGAFQFSFTNLTGVNFTVLASSNLTLPAAAWSNLGSAVETPAGSGQFQFTDPQATNNAQQFYRVRSP